MTYPRLVNWSVFLNAEEKAAQTAERREQAYNFLCNRACRLRNKLPIATYRQESLKLATEVQKYLIVIVAGFLSYACFSAGVLGVVGGISGISGISGIGGIGGVGAVVACAVGCTGVVGMVIALLMGGLNGCISNLLHRPQQKKKLNAWAFELMNYPPVQTYDQKNIDT